MTTITVPINEELLTFLNEEVKESGASKASLIRGLLHTYRQEKALERIREARREYEAGLGIEGDLATLLEKM